MLDQCILDTNALNSASLLLLLHQLVKERKIKIYLSPVVLLEYGYYQYLHNRLTEFNKLLKELHVSIAVIHGKDALNAIKHCFIYKEDSRGPSYFFRDALIAVLAVRLQIPLITNNTNNFKGLAHNLIITPQEFLDYFSSDTH